MPNKDLIFNPSKGIATSILAENAFMQCVDNDTVNGIARVNYQTETQITNFGGAIPFVLGGLEYVDTQVTTNWVTGIAVTLSSTVALPTGLSAGTVYYLRDASSVYANYWSIHPTYDDAKNDTNGITTSDTGSGDFTVTPVAMTYIRKFQQNRAIDSEGNLWEYQGVGDWELLSKGSGSGVGMETYGGFVYMFRGGDIDRYEIADGSVDVDWQTDTGGVSLVGQDDVMYIGVGNYIRSYDGSTYAAQAIDLPSSDSITAIAELGQYLAIGTNQNKIYLWDRVSPSFELPLSTYGVPRIMIPANNLIYFVIDSGDIYVTNGTTISLAKEFPRHILDNKEYPSFSLKPNAWRVQDRDIYIGYGSTTTTSPMGVYQFSLKDGDFKLSYIPSSGSTGGSSADRIRIDALQNSSKGIFFIGWTQAGSTYGLDRVSLTKRYTGYKAKVYSPLFKVGTKRSKRFFKHLEISLTEKLRTGQGVKVYYRENTVDDFTLLTTFNTAGEISYVLDKTLENLEFIQIKTEITTNNDSYTPNLQEIRLSE